MLTDLDAAVMAYREDCVPTFVDSDLICGPNPPNLNPGLSSLSRGYESTYPNLHTESFEE